MKNSTKNIHYGLEAVDKNFRSVIPPVYLSSTYRFRSADEGAKRFLGKDEGMIYARLQNPTNLLLEKRLAAIEEGDEAILTASGMGAITTVFFHFLKKGDSVVAHSVLYGGTMEFLSRIVNRFGVEVRFVDFKDVNQIDQSIDSTTKILYFESPTNPLLEVIDIQAVSQLAKKKKILTVFDNTFSPPPLQYPLKLGIDIVVHSLTKYIGGHSDLIGGAIIGKRSLIKEIREKTHFFLGNCLSPFNSYLGLRGLTTLELRIKKQSETALKIADFLSNHPKIDRVYYPAYNPVAKKQMTMFGGVLSFEVKGGYEKAKRLVNNVKLINLAVSLGAVESLIEHPASMTHSEYTKEEKLRGGITDGLVRLSVGLEDYEDLKDDLSLALKKI